MDNVWYPYPIHLLYSSKLVVKCRTLIKWSVCGQLMYLIGTFYLIFNDYSCQFIPFVNHLFLFFFCLISTFYRKAMTINKSDSILMIYLSFSIDSYPISSSSSHHLKLSGSTPLQILTSNIK